jgi:hypothetical protein
MADMWEERFKSGPVDEGQKSEALVLKVFKYTEFTEPRLMRFEAKIYSDCPFQPSAKASLFSGGRWNDVDYLFGQEMKFDHDNDIAKIFDALQKRAEIILTHKAR